MNSSGVTAGGVE
jgi:hypothetical protein